jgi:hypothetical protein
MKKLRSIFVLATAFVGAMSLHATCAAQTLSDTFDASSSRSKRMFTGTFYKVIGAVAAVEIINEEGSLTGASPNQTYRIRLVPTSRSSSPDGITYTSIGTSDGPYCGTSSQWYAYLNGNEPYARSMYFQALTARLAGDPVTLILETNGTLCHIYVINTGGYF